MVCEFNRVAEYDLKTGKELVESTRPTTRPRVSGSERQHAHHAHHAGPGGKVVEVEPNGDIVWEYESKDGLRAARAYRR